MKKNKLSIFLFVFFVSTCFLITFFSFCSKKNNEIKYIVGNEIVFYNEIVNHYKYDKKFFFMNTNVFFKKKYINKKVNEFNNFLNNNVNINKVKNNFIVEIIISKIALNVGYEVNKDEINDFILKNNIKINRFFYDDIILYIKSKILTKKLLNDNFMKLKNNFQYNFNENLNLFFKNTEKSIIFDIDIYKIVDFKSKKLVKSIINKNIKEDNFDAIKNIDNDIAKIKIYKNLTKDSEKFHPKISKLLKKVKSYGEIKILKIKGKIYVIRINDFFYYVNEDILQKKIDIMFNNYLKNNTNIYFLKFINIIRENINIKTYG